MSKHSTNLSSSIYHETRKQGDRINKLSREVKRQAEKSRDEYLKNRRDPYQTLMIIGTNMDIHPNDNMYNKVHDESRLIQRPYKGREIITHDKYDGRALLDDIPEEGPVKFDYNLEHDGLDKDLESMLNYERYRILIEAYRATVNEQKMIEYCEQKINTFLVSHSKFGTQVPPVDNHPKAPKTYTLYGFNYEQPENSEGLVKEVIETYERPVVKEEKKEDPEIYDSEENVILPDALTDMFAQDQCHVPWYGILKSFEDAQKKYEMSRPRKYIYGGEIIEEQSSDSKIPYKERKKVSKQNFKEKIIQKCQEQGKNAQQQAFAASQAESAKQEEGEYPEEKVFIEEFDLDDKSDTQMSEESKPVLTKSGKQSSFINFDLLKDFFPHMNEIKRQYFDKLNELEEIEETIGTNENIKEATKTKEQNVNISTLLKKKNNQESGPGDQEKVKSIMQKLLNNQGSTEVDEHKTLGSIQGSTGKFKSFKKKDNIISNNEEATSSPKAGLFKKRGNFSKRNIDTSPSPQRDRLVRRSPQYTPPSQRVASKSKSPLRSVQKNRRKNRSSSSSSSSDSSRSSSSDRKNRRHGRKSRSKSKDRRRDRNHKGRSDKKPQKNKSRPHRDSRSRRKHRDRRRSRSNSDSVSSSSSSSSSGSSSSSRSSSSSDSDSRSKSKC